MNRSQLVANRLYCDNTGTYFVSPDGVGVFWFDSMDEVNDQYDVGHFTRIYFVSGLTDW